MNTWSTNNSIICCCSSLVFSLSTLFKVIFSHYFSQNRWTCLDSSLNVPIRKYVMIQIARIKICNCQCIFSIGILDTHKYCWTSKSQRIVRIERKIVNNRLSISIFDHMHHRGKLLKCWSNVNDILSTYSFHKTVTAFQVSISSYLEKARGSINYK